jgi:uncharacterized membrane protein YraQ (UPF0718 family)
MNIRKEYKAILGIIVGFIVCFYLPTGNERFNQAVLEAFALVRWYSREHVLLCLVPAFFIAGAVGIFISQGAVIKYLGAGANKFLAYTVAALSGTILAVCSCTVLPLFSGIHKRGAGLGPAIAFLYSGPAINVLAIIMTARILGIEIGIARAVGAILFSVIIGLIMSFIFRNDTTEIDDAELNIPKDYKERKLIHTVIYFAAMVCILIFANFAKPEESSGLWHSVWSIKWYLTAFSALILGVALTLWFNVKIWKIVVSGAVIASLAFFSALPPMALFFSGVVLLTWIIATASDKETAEWLDESWWYAKMILPLLLIGVLIAGFLLGRPGSEGMIPSGWIADMVGGNSLQANLFASFSGAFMYFATLTEVPILQGLMANGMGKGPALALLLAGPALSLPNMLVIRQVIGTKKTFVYVSLVIIMATISGMIFGALPL